MKKFLYISLCTIFGFSNLIAQNTTNLSTESSTDKTNYSTWVISIVILTFIFLFWLASKSKKGEIIVFKNWGDVIITFIVALVTLILLGKEELHISIRILFIIMAFTWSCWISIKRNDTAGIGMGITIGIARILVVFLVTIFAWFAWTAMQTSRGNFKKSKGVISNKERAELISNAQGQAALAAIGFAISTWLTTSFIQKKP